MSTWAAVVLTCQDKNSAQVYQRELDRRQKEGLLDRDVVCLTVEDPAHGVGSGGATLNALLLVTEHLSAKAGYTVVNGDVLKNVNILIVHVGRKFSFDACGCAFVSVPAVRADNKSALLVCNLDLLLETMSHFPHENPAGVWVCCTDMFLHLDHSFKTTLAGDNSDVVLLAVPGSIHYASKHGVYHVDNEKGLVNVIFQGPEESLDDCVIPGTDTVPLVTGIVWLNTRFVDKLLSMIVLSPLDACTYMGLDSGANPIQISLFFDLLLPMCSSVTESNFVSGDRGGPYGRPLMGDGVTQVAKSLMLSARSLLWNTLHGSKAAVVVVSGNHSYMDNKPATHARHLQSLYVRSVKIIQNNRCQAFLHEGADCDESAKLINTRLADGVKVQDKSVLSHCYIEHPIVIGSNCVLNGIWTVGLDKVTTKPVLPDSLLLQTLHINLPGVQGDKCLPVITVFGINDDLAVLNAKTFCNVPWEKFLERTGIHSHDLWSHVSENEQTLENARLFPVLHPGGSVGWNDVLWLCGAVQTNTLHTWRNSWRLSFHELVKYTDVRVEFDWRKNLFYMICEQIIKDTLINQRNMGLKKLYRTAVVDDRSQQILKTLDKVGMETDDPGIAARTLANIADMLGAMAEGKGGLRSGPASNSQWHPAFKQLEAFSLRSGVEFLASVRKDWCDRPDLLVRAARHYEGAAQILIRLAVMTARRFIRTSEVNTTIPLGSWVTVECPARIDISGGWSDTPPITYEHGGAVLNAAITLDGKKPIGARVRRIAEPKIIIHAYSAFQAKARGDGGSIITVQSLSHLNDHNQPHAPGALLKAALICAKIVEYPSLKNLQSQLIERHGGGLEIQTWSNLPQGSGLGTSSILAGAVMAALWTCSSQAFDIVSLNHAVLHLEQMLTTGGGWQDQVGGLTGGLKVGHSPVGLPLKVDMTRPVVLEKTIKDFSDRLVLVYTGKTRLARNLLQNVVRNWYARDDEIMQTEDNLVTNAWECAKFFEQADMKGIGNCMDRYWQLKKIMASGSEPVAVTKMMQELRPYALGMVLAGAGGGGFMYVLTKEPHSIQTVKKVLSSIKDIDETVTVHEAEIDHVGMTVTIEGQGSVFVPYSRSS